MVSTYPLIKAVHVHAIGVSFAIFFLRGLLMLARSKYANHAVLRHTSYVVDTTLLAAALMLSALLGQYPFVHAWLTAKVLLLVAYIVTGSYALKRARTQRGRIIALLLALGCFGLIVAIARAHHWAGPFAASLR
ncbi:MAG: SirB2 family protein [Xanthomonadales bacterium]|nr:SirB2 family protein [Xanthomonadales bacterium]